MYKIHHQLQAEHDIVHVGKLMPYYPDFGERLYSWIEADHPTQYRDQEAQTSKPVLQDQPVAVVDIPLQISDPTPDPEPAEPHPDESSPVETNEANSAEPAETKVQPAVLETLSDSTPYPDQESPTGSSNDLETETAQTLCSEGMPDPLHPVQADPDDPDVRPEVEPTDSRSDPGLGLTETQTGSRSPVPSPRRGT